MLIKSIPLSLALLLSILETFHYPHFCHSKCVHLLWLKTTSSPLWVTVITNPSSFLDLSSSYLRKSTHYIALIQQSLKHSEWCWSPQFKQDNEKLEKTEKWQQNKNWERDCHLLKFYRVPRTMGPLDTSAISKSVKNNNKERMRESSIQEAPFKHAGLKVGTRPLQEWMLLPKNKCWWRTGWLSSCDRTRNNDLRKEGSRGKIFKHT